MYIKRVATVWLTIVVFFSCAFSVLSDATDEKTFDIVISTVTAVPGDEVVFNVDIVNNPAIAAVTITFHYDKSVMEYTGYYDGLLKEDTLAEHDSYVSIVYCSGDMTKDGTLFGMGFKVKEGAQVGEYPVTIKSHRSNESLKGSFANMSGDKLLAKAIPGKLKINYDGTNCKHKFSAFEEVVPAGCESVGVESRSCKICGKKEEMYIAAQGHIFSDWTVTKKPTCIEKGVEAQKCTVCGEIEERAVNTLAHNYGGIDFIPATCQSNGERIKICTDCNHKETAVIIGGSHIYKNGKCVSCDIAAEVVESTHNYDRNTNKIWTVTKKDADNLSVAFSSQTETESGYDFIYIYDKNDSLIGTYSGTELAGKTISVTGDTVKIKLTSDNSSQKYGFYATVTPISSNVIIGDTDNNGELDANDILNVRFSILSGKSTSIYDINGDGKVNVKDLIKIKKLIAEAA